MRRDSLREPRFSTVLRAFALLALAACAALLVARGSLGGGLSAQAQQDAYTLDENLPSFPSGVPSRSGVVEMDPVLAPLSRPSPAIPGTGRATEPGTTGAAASPQPTFGANVRVNQDVGAAPQNEPSITANPRDPTKLAAGSNDYRAFAPAFSDGHPGVYFSVDGGASWSDGGGGPVPGILPAPAGFVWGSRGVSGQLAGGDPSLAGGPGSDVYYGFIAFNNVSCSDGGVYIARSSDAGATWTTPVRVRANSGTEFQDKSYVAVDAIPGSPYSGRVYVSWTRFQTLSCGGTLSAAPIALSYSSGVSWSSPRTVSATGSTCNQGSVPAVGVDGDVYVAWWNCDTTPQRILVARSTNGGFSFSNPVQVAQVATIPSPLPPTAFRTNSFPAIATHPTNPNLLYVVWPSDPAGADDADIFFSRSTDGGATWSAPLRVNDDATASDQFFPWISVGPDGRINVVFGDRRDDQGDVLYHTYYAGSSDGGASFEPNVRVSDIASDPGINFNGTFIGDYFNVASASVHPTWTDTRNGDQDIFTAAGTTPATDSDGDGCLDEDEAPQPNDGFQPLLPGETGVDTSGDTLPDLAYDRLAWYDFYDVPTPANSDPTPNGARNQAINMADVLATLFYVGTCNGCRPNINGVDYDSLKDGDWNEDSVLDGLDEVGRRYDRRPSAAPNPPWDAGSPDGALNMADVLAALAQASLECGRPP
jgi:hypothetical protein